MYTAFLAHCFGSTFSALNRRIHHLFLAVMLVDMRVDAERTPRVSCDEEIDEHSSALDLVFEPNPKISEFYFRLISHNFKMVNFISHQQSANKYIYLQV